MACAKLETSHGQEVHIMASSNAKTVQEYLESLPMERRAIIESVRDVMLENMPEGIVEVMNWGMISYEIPLSTYPKTYNKKPLLYGALAAQKSHYAVYLSNLYMDEGRMDRLLSEYDRMGIKPNIGKSCVRFTKLEKLPLEVIGEMVGSMTLEDFVTLYEKMRAT